MALTQIQIIQSLGEAMNWLERELTWGVPPAELRHLIGRIGELYAALVTNGQMALEVNQRGYDVVSKSGERVSVKTTATLSAASHFDFSLGTLSLVDRVIILYVNTEEKEIETLLDASIEEARKLMLASGDNGKLVISLGKLRNRQTISPEPGREIRNARYGNWTIFEYDSGTIRVRCNEEEAEPAMPVLREIAAALGMSILNGNGNPYNTRQLGSAILDVLTKKG